MTDDFLLDRLAVVTGGASGIGRAIARRLATAGAAVTVLDRDGAAAQQVATEVGGTAIEVDLAESDALQSLVIEADVLVNCAGFQHVSAIEDFPIETFVRMQRLMVEVPFRLTRQVLPRMYAQGWGRLIHVTSVHGHRASPYKSAYVTAKHALEGFSKVVALEGAKHGVTSNTVAPGYVRTPLVDQQIAAQALAHGVSESDVVVDVLLARTPIPRLIEAGEVADAVAFLCGPSSQSMTGTALHLDGGWTAT